MMKTQQNMNYQNIQKCLIKYHIIIILPSLLYFRPESKKRNYVCEAESTEEALKKLTS